MENLLGLIVILSLCEVGGVADLADAAYLCYSVPSENQITFSRGGSGLDSFVGSNVLQELLYDSTCNFDSSCISKYTPAIIRSVLLAGGGLIMVLVVLFGFCGFAPCFCSRRWRQWSGWKRVKESSAAHHFNPKLRRTILFITCMASVGASVNIGLIAQQKSDVKSGLDAALCETYRFLNQTLYGGSAVVFDTSANYQLNARFPGLEQADAVLKNLTNLVESNGTLISSLNEVVNKTGIVEGEMTKLRQWLFALSFMMQINHMQQFHSCLFCSNFTAFPLDTSDYNPIHPSVAAVNNSLAGVLTLIRSQLRPFMSGSVGSIYTTLTTTSLSISSFVDELTRVVNKSVLENLGLIQDITRYFDTAITVMLVLTLFPICLALFAVFKGAYKSDKDSFTDPEKPPTSTNMIIASIWITLIYTIVAFFLCGATLIVAQLLASVCLVMEDAGTVAAKLSFRLGSADVSSKVVGITQQCLQAGTDGDILSAIVVDGESTARDKVNTLTALSGEFEILQKTFQGGGRNTNLSDNVFLNNIGIYVDEVGDLFLVTAKTNRTKMAQNSSLAPLASAAIFSTNYAQGLEVYNDVVFSAPQCSDRVVRRDKTPIGVQALLSNYTYDASAGTYSISGMTSVLSQLSTNGVNTGVLQCPASSSPSTNKVPWGNLLSLKIAIMANTTMKCAVPRVSYNSNTYIYNASLTKSICNTTAYRAYMSNFGERIFNQSVKVDDAVANNFDSILDTLWSVIYDQLMQPIQRLGSDLNCQFISIRWNSLFGAMCKTFTPNLIKLGNSLIGLGFAGLFALIIEIIIWRHLKDNYCHWKDYVGSPEGAPGATVRGSLFANVRISALWNAWGSALFSRGSVIVNEPGPQQSQETPQSTTNIPKEVVIEGEEGLEDTKVSPQSNNN